MSWTEISTLGHDYTSNSCKKWLKNDDNPSGLNLAPRHVIARGMNSPMTVLRASVQYLDAKRCGRQH